MSESDRTPETSGGYPEELRFSRAREYHLYTPEGERYLDCILGGGAAVLGHTPKGLTQAIKNRLSAGPLVPAPGKEQGKLRQAVRRLFPAVRWVVPVYAEELPEAILTETPIWRPFETELPDGSHSWPQPPGERFLLVPSFPLEPGLLLFCGTTHWVPEEVGPGAPASEPGLHPRLISPVFLAGVTKALHLVVSAYEGEAVPRRLTKQERDGWRHPLPPAQVWERNGIYYRYTRSPGEYEELRLTLQERGILIPRDPWQPMVCPRIITSHERSLWEAVHSTL